MRTSTLMAAAALCASASLLAQAPANDDCANAIAVGLGTTSGNNLNATSDPANPMPCGLAGSDADVWYTFTAVTSTTRVSLCSPGTDYDTKLEIQEGSCAAPVSITCNDDFCSLQSEITFASVAGTTYFIRVGGFNAAQGNFDMTISAPFDLEMVGIAENPAGSGTLGTDGGSFTDGDTLRWNYNDVNNNFFGLFAATVMNVGIGGSEPIGATPQIPGFGQVWAGSNPAGTETVYGPFGVGTGDQQVTIPAGLFGNGDTVRLQGLVLDPINALGAFPVIPTDNQIEWTYTPAPPTCSIEESFDTTPTGLNYPTGWSNGGGTNEWRVDDLGTPSFGTGPTGAFNGSNYMFTETSGVAGGNTFIMNTDTYTDATATKMSFYLSAIGSGMGTIEVFYDDGSGPVSVFSQTGPGPGQSQGGTEWALIEIPFTATASYSFQFVYTHGSSFTGDCAIDRFCIGN